MLFYVEVLTTFAFHPLLYWQNLLLSYCLPVFSCLLFACLLLFCSFLFSSFLSVSVSLFLRLTKLKEPIIYLSLFLVSSLVIFLFSSHFLSVATSPPLKYLSSVITTWLELASTSLVSWDNLRLAAYFCYCCFLVVLMWRGSQRWPVHQLHGLWFSGLSKEGWYITKNLCTELFIIFFGFFTFVPAIQVGVELASLYFVSLIKLQRQRDART